MAGVEHFNGLNPAHHELVTKIGEEATESAQAAFKILLHGIESFEPANPDFSNRDRLENELGQLLFYMQLAEDNGLISMKRVFEASRKCYKRKTHYLHHVDVE
jgi:NTP pyrophosphatase (non-canonical NTP hydrolase)